MPVPIIFVHKGDPYYLDFSINQAHASSPGSPVYLVTDTLTMRYSFVNYVDMNRYNKAAQQFEKIYKHGSTNSYNNELFCFQRWFVIRDFCAAEKINNFLYLDSDLMLYCDADKTFGKFSDVAFTITKQISPHCCYFSSQQHLSSFCNFVIRLYTDPVLIPRFEKKWEYHVKNSLPGGVCDMTAFFEYRNDHSGCARDLLEIVNGETFDDNINEPDGFVMDEHGLKKIEFINGAPYGTLKESGEKVKFNNLHFQGRAKPFLPGFYTGSNLKKLKLKLRLDAYLKDHYYLHKALRILGYKSANV
jgi:hypothetical protein